MYELGTARREESDHLPALAVMSSPPKLKIDWCSYDAVKYAAQHWHYSRSLPCSKTARLGVWEDDRFIGAVVLPGERTGILQGNTSLG